MQYPYCEYKFGIGQTVRITRAGDQDYGKEATINFYSYYPSERSVNEVCYELNILEGYDRFLFWKTPRVRHRGMYGWDLETVDVQ